MKKVVYIYNLSYLCFMKKIITYKHYFLDFISSISKEEVDKIRRALDLLRTEERVPRHYIVSP